MNIFKTKSTLLFTFIFAIIAQFAFSQNNYLSGYVITLEKDTIQGFIDYKNWNRNPINIDFKLDKSSKATAYAPIDISEFVVNNEIYVSANVEIEISSTQTNSLEQNSAANIRPEKVFLQTLFRGVKSLYSYKSSIGKDNFYIKEGSNFQLLTYKRYSLLMVSSSNNSKTVIKENKNYKGQLVFYLNDCASISSKLAQTEYNAKSLQKVFNYYYNCSQNELTFQKKKEKLAIDLGLLAGVSFSSITFDGSILPYLTEGNFEQSTSIMPGMFVELFFSRNQKKWSLNNEIVLSSSTYKGNHKSFSNETGEVKTNVELDYSYLKLNSLIRYYIPLNQESTRLFLNVGMSNGLAIREKNYKQREIFFGAKKLEEGEALESTRTYEQGLVLGIGLKHNKLSFETRFELGNGMSDFATLGSATQRLQVLLGYRF